MGVVEESQQNPISLMWEIKYRPFEDQHEKSKVRIDALKKIYIDDKLNSV